MWKSLGHFVLRFRILLLTFLFLTTAVMAWYASKVQLSYDFIRAIPADDPQYQEYLAFKKQYGEDGNLLVVGIQSDKLFQKDLFNAYSDMHQQMKTSFGVEDVLSICSAIDLTKDSQTLKLKSRIIFPLAVQTQAELDSGRNEFLNLPFYKGLLYNPDTHAYLMGVRINKDILNSKSRSEAVASIEKIAKDFGVKNQVDVHLSGLPEIRNSIATRIAKEMQWFLAGSILLSAIILFVFFRSVGTTLLSLAVVLIGVVWSLALIHICGYRITILSALIPPLIVVIGVPNCIYFLNKYHTAYLKNGDKRAAIVEMVSKMGIVTLFCNLTAAIGFAVFALTKSAILKEFGVVAGLSIMVIFFISFILFPAALSFLPEPKERHTKYLESKWLDALLSRIERWVFNHKSLIYVAATLIVAFAVMGILRLKSEGYIVDDLPKNDPLYTDLKFFEKNFKGVMPLEILVDTKKKFGFVGARALPIFEKVDSLAQYIASKPEMARPLSLAEGLKFARQAFYEGDSTSYALPNSFDGAFVGDYLRARKDSSDSKNTLQKLMAAFMDSNRQTTRISVNMADVGSKRLPEILADLKRKSDQLFDSSKYRVEYTGSSVTFLAGSRFIIEGLKQSILWAFLLIALCMLYLFRSFRILICSLIPNLIPLMLTAGVMGWAGISLKPSTVLVFSVALGIAIDVTIRFLVNYKQELPNHDNSVKETVMQTIHSTGISILYTSMVLIAGFVIFVLSGFGGTKALGWLTSLTLLSATVTNLVLLPVLLLTTSKKGKEK